MRQEKNALFLQNQYNYKLNLNGWCDRFRWAADTKYKYFCVVWAPHLEHLANKETCKIKSHVTIIFWTKGPDHVEDRCKCSVMD